MANPTQKFTTPVGDLSWVLITGQGKKNLKGKDCYVASLEFDETDPALKQLEAQLLAFWEANKPSGAKLPKTLGIKVVKDKDGNPTNRKSVNFWTGISNQDDTPKHIKTYNAKAVEVSLGNKKIGNGSRGSISGAMAIFDQGVASRGVTLYLNAIQITKLVEYSDGPGFAAVDEDGWTGEDADSGFEPQAENTARPKL